MIDTRYELAISRIRDMKEETAVKEPFGAFFRAMADFAVMIDEEKKKLETGVYEEATLEEIAGWNHRLYADILPENYDKSYGNPTYAAEVFGPEYGRVLGFLYAELRSAIAYVFEGRTEYLDILFELLIEVYNQFEGEELPEAEAVKETLYWYASDYCDVFTADHIRSQIDPSMSFAADIIRDSDLTDLRYLYKYGEYVSDNEVLTAKHLLEQPEELIQKMADVFTEGLRMGFENAGKDLSKKSTVNVRFIVGFERVIRKALENFEKLGLAPVIYRSGVTSLTKRQQIKVGYWGGIANKQYEYDHKDDQALFFDKKFVERKLEVIQTTYEQYKDLARQFAGPACSQMFGEKPFAPERKEEVWKLSEKQEELSVSYSNRQSRIMNEYMPGDERSFTIITYPVPEIGEKYEEIFNEVIRINTLDAKVYEKVQQCIIDALDQGESVRILGAGDNRTDLKIQLYKLNDPEKETIFENCISDVNIPVGEVFTSPVLEGTNGVLHVSKVYLNELQYKDLEITFANGMIADYTCKNFEHELENKEYIHDNILHKHPTLPIGEFAIGTNTTAYVAAKKYGIEDKMPILIAEKMGPHFAVGDTCFNWSEDVKVYNSNGKEVVARDNSVSILRKEDVSKAYYNCHTDITIPYEELKLISVIKPSGEEIVILENGQFVLEGTEILNEPLKNTNK